MTSSKPAMIGAARAFEGRCDACAQPIMVAWDDVITGEPMKRGIWFSCSPCLLSHDDVAEALDDRRCPCVRGTRRGLRAADHGSLAVTSSQENLRKEEFRLLVLRISCVMTSSKPAMIGAARAFEGR
jgi:hypothetical protein